VNRWDHNRTQSRLVNPSGVWVGEAARVRPGGVTRWAACLFRDWRYHGLGTFATRAAAMRAVASACDAKKGCGL
jgi:hypothetical protein